MGGVCLNGSNSGISSNGLNSSAISGSTGGLNFSLASGGDARNSANSNIFSLIGNGAGGGGAGAGSNATTSNTKYKKSNSLITKKVF